MCVVYDVQLSVGGFRVGSRWAQFMTLSLSLGGRRLASGCAQSMQFRIS